MFGETTSVTPEDKVEIYEQLARITPDFEKAIRYAKQAENVKLNYNLGGIREKGCYHS